MSKKEDIGIKIRVARKSRGITQAALAKMIGQSPSSIAMYESGQREPEYEVLEALADVFNVPMAYFLLEKDITVEDSDRLEDMHQNPRLGVLFDRSRKMSHEDVEMMIQLMDRILKERDNNG